MIEYLKPLVSFIKLVNSGIKYASTVAKVEIRKDAQRSILEIHLLLVDIIDNANSLLSIVKGIDSRNSITKENINIFLFFLNMQRDRLEMLGTLIRGATFKQLIDIFSPTTRISLEGILVGKGTAIDHIAMEFDNYNYDEYREKLPYYDSDLSLINWTADVNSASLMPTTHKTLSICDRVVEQDAVVSDLIQCSQELAGIIRSVINFDDIISYVEQ